MTISDNYNLFNLFLTKRVKIRVDNKNQFEINLPSIRDLSLNEAVNATFHIMSMTEKEVRKSIPVDIVKDSFDFAHLLLFNLGKYREYSETTDLLRNGLLFFIPNVVLDYKTKQLIVDDITITKEIWEYILYLLKLSYGEKAEKPRTFGSEDERKFYLAQKEMDERIKNIKSQKKGDSEGLLKAFLSIQYKFNLSFDYLAEQTMAQIHWLQEYAAGAVSYEVNAQAFAAGNVKKGKKLDFFIK